MPFGEYVEGFSYGGYEAFALEAAVLPEDFKNLTFHSAIRINPLIFKGLRKFKHFGSQVGIFVSRPVESLRLQNN